MCGHTLQHVAEIGKFFRAVLFTGTVEVCHKCFHAVEAGFVKRLKDVERGEQERAGTARRIEDGHARGSGTASNRLPEGSEQFRAFAMLNHVLCELSNVEIMRKQVVYICDFAVGDFSI